MTFLANLIIFLADNKRCVRGEMRLKKRQTLIPFIRTSHFIFIAFIYRFLAARSLINVRLFIFIYRMQYLMSLWIEVLPRPVERSTSANAVGKRVFLVLLVTLGALAHTSDTGAVLSHLPAIARTLKSLNELLSLEIVVD